MALFAEMKNRLSKAGETTVKRARDLQEVARLNGEITAAENQINDLYSQIGYEVYRLYHDNPLPEVAGQITNIHQLHQSIEEKKARIREINSADLCPQCGTKIRPGMAFCSNCGYRLPTAEAAVAQNVARMCRKCGAIMTPNTLFCTACGTRWEPLENAASDSGSDQPGAAFAQKADD